MACTLSRPSERDRVSGENREVKYKEYSVCFTYYDYDYLCVCAGVFAFACRGCIVGSPPPARLFFE